MKKILFIITICILFTLTSCGKSNSSENTQSSAASNLEGQQIKVILYFPPTSDSYLVPEERDVIFSKSLEQTLVLELLRGTKNPKSRSLPEGTALISVKKSGDTVKVNLSSEFKKNINEMNIYSIVNTLTEIPGVTKVIINTEGKNISGGIGDKSFERNRQLFNRDRGLNPSEVLLRQMKYEQEGKWLDSYLLMSDRQDDKFRKYFNDYVYELEEMKLNGFLGANFTVGEYTIKDDKAKVKVNFYTTGDNGEKIPSKDVFFNCVKINGVWMVDWLTAQKTS